MSCSWIKEIHTKQELGLRAEGITWVGLNYDYPGLKLNWVIFQVQFQLWKIHERMSLLGFSTIKFYLKNSVILNLRKKSVGLRQR